MLTGRQIMEAAGILLLDETYVRWPLAELAKWINEGVRAIILAKPSAKSTTIAVQLQKGTLQSVPQTGDPQPLRLLSIVRNLKSADDRVGGRIVRPTKRSLLDAQAPYWHDERRVRFQKEVRQFCFDEENPLEFYTYPGNDGNGIVEAVVSTLPAPLEPSGDPEDIASWEADIGLQEIYLGPLTDYVLYRSQLKDDVASNTGRSAIHYQQFATALGIKVQTERTTSPNRDRAL